jgi:hypothetical protein
MEAVIFIVTGSVGLILTTEVIKIEIKKFIDKNK